MSIPVYFTVNTLGAGQGKEAPADWEFAGRTLDSLINMLLAFGHAPTIFASPESLRAHTPLLEEAEDRGCTVGLLVAPNQSVLLAGKRPMGMLSIADQEQHLLQAMEWYQRYMYKRPTVVRTGFFSGNEATIQLCQKHHFTHSSIALPGAQLGQLGTVWNTHTGQVTTYGGLTDIPPTTNPDERLFNRFPVYFSPEFGETDVYDRLISRGKALGHLCIVANNHVDYWDDESPIRHKLYDLLCRLERDTDLAPTPIPPPYQE